MEICPGRLQESGNWEREADFWVQFSFKISAGNNGNPTCWGYPSSNKTCEIVPISAPGQNSRNEKHIQTSTPDWIYTFQEVKSTEESRKNFLSFQEVSPVSSPMHDQCGDSYFRKNISHVKPITKIEKGGRQIWIHGLAQFVNKESASLFRSLRGGNKNFCEKLGSDFPVCSDKHVISRF